MGDQSSNASVDILSLVDSSDRTITSGDVYTADTVSFDETEKVKPVDLESEVINDDKWSCVVALIAASDWIYEQDLDLLKKYSSLNKRPAIELITPSFLTKAVSKIDKEKEINEKEETNGSETSIKTKNIKNNKKGKKVMEQSENIQVSGAINKQALDIKKYILYVKSKKDEATSDKKSPINKIELVESQKNGGNIKQKKKTKGNDTKYDKSKNMKIKDKGKTKAKASNQPESNLHDEPQCGPNKYFVLLGFQNVKLISRLLDMHVPLVALFSYGKKGSHVNTTENRASINQIVNEEYDPFSVDTDEDIESKEDKKQKMLEIKGNKTIQFWKDIVQLINKSTFNYKLNDITIINCSSPNLTDYQSREKNPKEKGKILFDFLAKILYRLAEEMREYVHYINAAEAMNISWAERILANVFQPYSNMLNEVPLEYITVEYILYCMIENVASYNEKQKKKFETLKENTKCVMCNPTIISRNNKVNIKSFMVERPDLCKISTNLYKYMPYAKLINCLKSDVYNSSKFKFQLNLLHQCMKMKSLSEEHFEIFIHRMLFSEMLDKICLTYKPIPLHMIVQKHKFRKVGRRTLQKRRKDIKKKKKVKLQLKKMLSRVKLKAYTDKGKEDEEIFKKQRIKELMKVKQFVNCEEIEHLKEFSVQNNKFLKHDIIEDLNTTELLQSLQRASTKYSNMYFLPYKGTNSLLIFFHNDYNKCGLYKTQSSVSLKIPIGFRDYFSYEKKLIKGWLQRQKAKIQRIDIIKHFETNPLKKNYFNRSKKPNAIYPHPKKLLGSQYDNDGFTLYNICEHRQQCDEVRNIFYSNDGVVVTVTVKEWIKQYTYLSLIINSFGTIITYHYIINDENDLIIEPNLHLNITTKDNVIITCIQNMIKQESHNEKNVVSTERKSFSKHGKHFKKKKTLETLEMPVYKDFYDFNVTLPTGLKIEIRHNKPFIKQYYIEGSSVRNEIKHELCRLYFRNGMVIVFEKEGRIVVMYANGSKVQINKIVKRKLFIDPGDEALKLNKKGGKNKKLNKKQRKMNNADKANEDNIRNQIKKDETVEKKEVDKTNKKGKTTIKNKSTETIKSDKKNKKNKKIKASKKNKKNEESNKNSNENDTAKKTEKKDGSAISKTLGKSVPRPKIMIEKAFLTDIEVFSWNGEYLSILDDEVTKPVYKHKLNVSKDTSQIIYNKVDGTSGVYKNGGLNVLYSDGTLITSEISNIDEIEVKTIASRQMKTDEVEDFIQEEFNKIFCQYVTPVLQQISPKINSETLTQVHKVLLKKFPNIRIRDKYNEDEIKKKNEEKIWRLFEYGNELNVDEEETKKNEQFTEVKNDNYTKDNKEEGEDEENEVDEQSFIIIHPEYTIQHHLYANVNYKDKEKMWIINFPTKLQIAIGQDCNCTIADNTSIIIKNMIVTLLSDNNMNKTTTTKINLTKKFQNNNDIIFETIDSDGRRFEGYANGRVHYSGKDASEKFLIKDTKMFNRFYVLKPDLTGYEFIHNDDNEIERNKYTEENTYKNFKEVILVNSLNIYKTISDTFDLPIKDPFKYNVIRKKHLSNFFERPMRWIFNTPCVHIKNQRESPMIRPKRPLAVVYRKVRLIKTNFERIYARLMKAFKKLNLIRDYLYEQFDSNTTFSTDVKPASYMNKRYKSIYKYIGVAPKNKPIHEQLEKKKNKDNKKKKKKKEKKKVKKKNKKKRKKNK